MSVDQPLRLAMVRCGALSQQHHLTTLCRYLADKGFELEFLSLQAPATDVAWFAEQVPGMEARALGEWGGMGVGRFFRGGSALRRALKRTKFDILYVVDSWTLRYLAVATLGSMRWRECPLIYHTFDMLVPHVAAGADILLERHAARRSQLNINTDRSRAAVIKALFGLKQTPLAIPLLLPRDTVLPTRDAALRASLLDNRTETDQFLVVCPTHLSGERLSKEIIESFAFLPQNYHLVTIDGTGGYARECHDLIAHLGLAARLRVLQPMPHHELLRICACADVGLILHDAEASLGNYLCHSSRLAYFVALGLPVVATDVPSLESVVYQHALGICCSSTDPQNIALALKEICTGSIPLLDRRKAVRDAFENRLYYERDAATIAESLRRLAPH